MPASWLYDTYRCQIMFEGIWNLLSRTAQIIWFFFLEKWGFYISMFISMFPNGIGPVIPTALTTDRKGMCPRSLEMNFSKGLDRLFPEGQE